MFGEPRPVELRTLALPPGPMPARDRLRPLKAWRYVGVFGPELMVCAAHVRIGPVRQEFWAVWDRLAQRLYERTRLHNAAVRLQRGLLRVQERDVQIEISLEEEPGVETICPTGTSYAWTRKQAGVRARGVVALDGEIRVLDARAAIDDTAAYYERHTTWQWSAGVGAAADGRAVAWNLVAGVNDPPEGSERTVWIDGVPHEAAPVQFAPDLSRVGALRFTTEAVRERRENRLLVRSAYRQPFGTFSGELPGGRACGGGIELADGFGVMEEHDVWW